MNIRKSIEAASSRRPASKKRSKKSRLARAIATAKSKHRLALAGRVTVTEDQAQFDAAVADASQVPLVLRVGVGSRIAATGQTLGDLTAAQAKSVGTMLGIHKPIASYVPVESGGGVKTFVVLVHGDTTCYVARTTNSMALHRRAWLIAIARATGGAS
tara:strand:- start:26 stop:499 length:474 start_codon:yes stop_codon:yes gene_type:complete